MSAPIKLKAKSAANDDAADWANELRAILKPKPEEIPKGFLKVSELVRIWKLSDCQVRRLLRRGMESGHVEKLYINGIGSDNRPCYFVVFGMKRGKFDVSRPSK